MQSAVLAMIGSVLRPSVCPSVPHSLVSCKNDLTYDHGTNRKSHTRFRLVPKLSTLDDLERPMRSLLQKRCVFWSPLKNVVKDRPYYQWRKYRAMTLVSGNIRCMRIMAGVPLGGGSQMTVGLSKKHFLRLYAATSSETLEIRPAIL